MITMKAVLVLLLGHYMINVKSFISSHFVFSFDFILVFPLLVFPLLSSFFVIFSPTLILSTLFIICCAVTISIPSFWLYNALCLLCISCCFRYLFLVFFFFTKRPRYTYPAAFKYIDILNFSAVMEVSL